MHIRKKYNLTITSDSLLLYPYQPAVPMAWRMIGAMVPAAVVLFFLRNWVGEVLWASLYVIIAYSILYSLYEIFIKARIHYQFSMAANAVYKRTLFATERKLMRLDEVVIFTSSEMGSWRYMIGAKRTHFVKNYAISESFSVGKKSVARQERYEQEILEVIERMVASVKEETSK